MHGDEYTDDTPTREDYFQAFRERLRDYGGQSGLDACHDFVYGSALTWEESTDADAVAAWGAFTGSQPQAGTDAKRRFFSQIGNRILAGA